MKITERYYQVDSAGSLYVPPANLCEMGLHPGDRVCLAYLATEDGRNQYAEFAVLPAQEEDHTPSEQLQLPVSLLAQAQILPGDDVQILCLTGALMISKAATLSVEELRAVRRHLTIATGITDQLTGNPVDDVQLLRAALEEAAEL